MSWNLTSKSNIAYSHFTQPQSPRLGNSTETARSSGSWKRERYAWLALVCGTSDTQRGSPRVYKRSEPAHRELWHWRLQTRLQTHFNIGSEGRDRKRICKRDSINLWSCAGCYATSRAALDKLSRANKRSIKTVYKRNSKRPSEPILNRVYKRVWKRIYKRVWQRQSQTPDSVCATQRDNKKALVRNEQRLACTTVPSWHNHELKSKIILLYL